MNELDDIKTRLEEYYAPSEANEWLTAPHPQLEGVSPLAAIADGRAHEVKAILDRLDSGVYL